MMPYCQLCEKASPCKHWPTEEARPAPFLGSALDTERESLHSAIDNAIRGKLDASKVSVGDQFPGTLVVDGTEYPAPETVVLNGYLYRRDDSSSVL